MIETAFDAFSECSFDKNEYIFLPNKYKANNPAKIKAKIIYLPISAKNVKKSFINYLPLCYLLLLNIALKNIIFIKSQKTKANTATGKTQESFGFVIMNTKPIIHRTA